MKFTGRVSCRARVQVVSIHYESIFFVPFVRTLKLVTVTY